MSLSNTSIGPTRLICWPSGPISPPATCPLAGRTSYTTSLRNMPIPRQGSPSCEVAPHLVYGAVLDNQKAVAVRGTFLQTAHYATVFYKENYTDIEMEAGPYLSAAYELARPKRHPRDEIVNLYNIPFDLGILHYA